MKQELTWKVEDRSIGIIENDDENERYIPIMTFNFDITGYVSAPGISFSGLEILLKTRSKEIKMVVKDEETKSFPVFLSVIQ